MPPRCATCVVGFEARNLVVQIVLKKIDACRGTHVRHSSALAPWVHVVVAFSGTLKHPPRGPYYKLFAAGKHDVLQ